MHGRSRLTALLPRLAGGSGRAPALRNGLGLLAASLVGAGLVHLLAYHIPTGVPLGPRWTATTLALLAGCPLRGPLGLIAVVAALAPLLAVREVSRLQRVADALTQLLEARRLALPAGHDAVPRSPRRLLTFVAALLALQVLGLAAAGLLCPMPTAMEMPMRGAAMPLPSSSALPLGLLHLAVAAALGLLLWRVEHRLTRLRAAVADRLRLLQNMPVEKQERVPYAARLPRPRHAHGLFARPPPVAA